MKALAARRRHPLAGVVLLMLGLMVTGTAYAVAAPEQADIAQISPGDPEQGRKLFLANCSTCHGTGGQGASAGPSLIGVGAASFDFQVGTGRMPLAATAPQAPQNDVKFSDQDVADLAAYGATLGPGPGIPAPREVAALTDEERIQEGNELFRINCAMCHNVVGAGGALTRGKYAPALEGVSEKHIYEAMVTGPQSMPVFNNANITPEEKQSIISYLKYIEEQPPPGGLALGSLGPVTEGLFAWIGLLGIIIACTIWLGAKSS